MKKTIKESDVFRWFSFPKALFRHFSSILGINGLAVYGLLAAYADQEFCSRLNYHKISQKLKITNAQAIRAIHLLEDLHLIRGEPREQKTRHYRLLWVPPWGKVCGRDGNKLEKRISPYRYDISINNNIEYDIDQLINSLKSKKYMNQDEETQFAYELAEALNDKEAIQMYLSYVHRFSESLLREVLAKVLSVPDNKIKKTRGALFNYLIQQHAAKTKYYPRD